MQRLTNILLAAIVLLLLVTGFLLALNLKVSESRDIAAARSEAGRDMADKLAAEEALNKQIAGYRANPYLHDIFSSQPIYNTSNAVVVYEEGGYEALEAYGRWTRHDVSSAMPYVRRIESADRNAALGKPWPTTVRPPQSGSSDMSPGQ